LCRPAKNLLNRNPEDKKDLLTLQQTEIQGKTEMLEAHMRLVDRSNERILARIEEIKLQRQREAIAEQERLLIEQQAAISSLQ
jgi:hypothetical protein